MGERERGLCSLNVRSLSLRQRTLHKDRKAKGGDLFLFTHLTVERSPFLLFYLTNTSRPPLTPPLLDASTLRPIEPIPLLHT